MSCNTWHNWYYMSHIIWIIFLMWHISYKISNIDTIFISNLFVTKFKIFRFEKNPCIIPLFLEFWRLLKRLSRSKKVQFIISPSWLTTYEMPIPYPQGGNMPLTWYFFRSFALLTIKKFISKILENNGMLIIEFNNY